MDNVMNALIHVAAYVAGATGLTLIVLRFVPAGRDLVQRAIGGHELSFMLFAAVAMTATSLYLSEVRHFIPCRLCWFQRVSAYPNVIVLGWAALRRDRNGLAPAVTLAALGAAFSIWHILLDVGWISESGSCDITQPCTVRWAGFNHWYSTIQVGAFMCFLFIIGIGLHALARPTTSPVEA